MVFLIFRITDILRRPADDFERYSLDLRCKGWVFMVAVQVDDGAGMFQAQVVGNCTENFSITPCNFLTKYTKTAGFNLELAPIDIRYWNIVELNDLKWTKYF